MKYESFVKSQTLFKVPDRYDRSDAAVVRDIQDFFNNWGQYVVVQVRSGMHL